MRGSLGVCAVLWPSGSLAATVSPLSAQESFGDLVFSMSQVPRLANHAADAGRTIGVVDLAHFAVLLFCAGTMASALPTIRRRIARHIG